MAATVAVEVSPHVVAIDQLKLAEAPIGGNVGVQDAKIYGRGSVAMSQLEDCRHVSFGHAVDGSFVKRRIWRAPCGMVVERGFVGVGDVGLVMLWQRRAPQRRVICGWGWNGRLVRQGQRTLRNRKGVTGGYGRLRFDHAHKSRLLLFDE